MKHVLILMGMALSAGAFASNANADGIYGCQFAKQYCGPDGGRYSQFFSARSYEEALRLCQSIATSNGESLCQVTSPTGDVGRPTPRPVPRPLPRPAPYPTTYGCQFATKYCGDQGGRYSEFFTAYSYAEALRTCRSQANMRNELLCQVTQPGF